MAKKRTETQEQMIKKLQQQVLEITNLNKKIQTLVSFHFLSRYNFSLLIYISDDS